MAKHIHVVQLIRIDNRLASTWISHYFAASIQLEPRKLVRAPIHKMLADSGRDVTLFHRDY